MRGAKPFVFIPVGMALFAAGIAATWPLSTTQFWICSGSAATASAAVLAQILTPSFRPNIDLEESFVDHAGTAR